MCVIMLLLVGALLLLENRFLLVLRREWSSKPNSIYVSLKFLCS